MIVLREKYWTMLAEYMYDYKYACIYRIYCIRVNNWLRISFAVATALSIAFWGVTNNIPTWWALMVGVLQLYYVIEPLLPFARSVDAINSFIPKLKRLLNLIDYDWLNVDRLDDSHNEDAINELVLKHRHAYDELIDRYIEGVYMRPHLKSGIQATRERDLYFLNYYGIRSEVIK